MGGKILATTKKSTSLSLKCEGDVDSFFDWKGIVHHEFVPRGEAVNKEFYLKFKTVQEIKKIRYGTFAPSRKTRSRTRSRTGKSPQGANLESRGAGARQLSLASPKIQG